MINFLKSYYAELNEKIDIIEKKVAVGKMPLKNDPIHSSAGFWRGERDVRVMVKNQLTEALVEDDPLYEDVLRLIENSEDDLRIAEDDCQKAHGPHIIRTDNPVYQFALLEGQLSAYLDLWLLLGEVQDGYVL